MSTLFIILQGGLIGAVAGWVYPNWGWEFFAICVANAVLTVAYGTSKKMEG